MVYLSISWSRKEVSLKTPSGSYSATTGRFDAVELAHDDNLSNCPGLNLFLFDASSSMVASRGDRGGERARNTSGGGRESEGREREV
ncbi:hypothetical protein ACHAWF_008189 [Thalassiosira exigua]